MARSSSTVLALLSLVAAAAAAAATATPTDMVASSATSAAGPVMTLLFPPVGQDGNILASVMDVHETATTFLVCPGMDGSPDQYGCDQGNYTIVAGPSTGFVHLTAADFVIEAGCVITTTAHSAQCTVFSSGVDTEESTTSTSQTSTTFTSLDDFTGTITVTAGYAKITNFKGAAAGRAQGAGAALAGLGAVGGALLLL